MSEPKSFLDSPETEELRKIYKESQEKYKKEVDSFWNSLSYDEQLITFYYITSNIYKGDVVERGSYRHVLYSTFGFEPDAYEVGIDCNYLPLHNIIYSGVDFEKMQTAKTIKIGDHSIDIDPKETLEFSFNEKTKELTIKTVDIFKEI